MRTKEQYIAERKGTMNYMISMYCNKKHGKDLCDDCRELRDYALERIESCMNNDSQTRCRDCPGRCYNPEMREKIGKVFDYARPRMILHPTKLFKRY